MPVIIYEGGIIPGEKKEELIASLTAAGSRITSIPETSFTVLLRENPPENWGVGGISLDRILGK